MLSLSKSALFVSSIAASALAIPTYGVDTVLTETRRENSIQKRAGPSQPRFVIYEDTWLNQGLPPAASAIPKFNVFIYTFWLPYGGADMVQAWQEATAAQRSSAKATLNAAGVYLMMAAFGATSSPTSSGYDPTQVAIDCANFAKQYDFDGVDVDYEDFPAMNGGTGAAWLVTFTRELRNQLGNSYIITHAPVAPWFSTNTTRFPDGAYQTVDREVGDLIDWYNVQYYNQGVNEYVDCTTLLTKSVAFDHASLFEIINSGIDPTKLVMGKPATAADATNGYMPPATQSQCVSQAKAKGWGAGLSFWQYPHEDLNVVSEIWGTGGVATTTKTTSVSTSASATKTTSSPATTTTSSSSPCNGIPAWSSTVAYTGGSEVVYSNQLWTAKYWSEADVPGGASGDWTLDGPC